MRLQQLFYLAVPLVVIASPASAQRAALSGTWVYAPTDTPATLPKAPSPVFGTRFDLRLDGATATLTRPAREGSFTAALPTDGTRTSSRIMGRLCEGESQFHESAAWEGDALVFTVLGITPAGGGTTSELKNRRIVRLVSPDVLVVEGTMVQQGQGRQVGAVYRRTSEPMPAARAPLPIKGIAATIDQVAWIGTTWIGTTGTVTTEERWTPPASGGLIGLARTLRNGTALASFEFLCIAERDGTLVYNAMPDARTPATLFVLTALTPTSATFENPAHDYPQVVRYSLTADGSLETTISATGGARARSVVLKKP